MMGFDRGNWCKLQDNFYYGLRFIFPSCIHQTKLHFTALFEQSNKLLTEPTNRTARHIWPNFAKTKIGSIIYYLCYCRGFSSYYFFVCLANLNVANIHEWSRFISSIKWYNF